MLPNWNASLMAVVALGVVLVLIWLSARAVRFSGLGRHAGNGRSLQVVETIALDPRRRLYLVACGERRVLLLTGGGSDVVVGWVEPVTAAEPVA